MKKATFTEKSFKISIPGYISYQLTLDYSYLNAILYGAAAGLVALMVIITFVILILS